MTNTELVARHLELLDVEESAEERRCCLCGKVTNRYFKEKKVLSEKFNDRDRFVCDSGVVCVECATCIKEPKLRRSSFYADENSLVFFKNIELEDIVSKTVQQAQGPFILCVTESFKKHNAFKARVNYDRDSFFVQAEDVEFWFPYKDTISLYNKMREAYKLFNKQEILTGEYVKIKDVDLEQLKAWEALFKPHRGRKYFEFLVLMLRKEKVNEK